MLQGGNLAPVKWTLCCIVIYPLVIIVACTLDALCYENTTC
jgi:hypothetical protein